MTVGDRIKERREGLGMSQDELARKLGYKSRSSVNKIELNQRNITQSKIKAIADALFTTPSYIMGWTDEPTHTEPATIPPGFEPLPEMTEVLIIGQIACGQPITAEENVEGIISIPAEWHADFILMCAGDSMAPKIIDGDAVAIRKVKEVHNGQIAAIRIDNEATLKKVYLYPDRLELRPINPDYDSIVLYGEDMNSAAIEGKAVGLCRGI